MQRHAPWWSYAGAVSGGGPYLTFIHSSLSLNDHTLTVIGFIIANLPGVMIGAYAGNRIGAIRDAKGKSVAAVFSELGGTQKAEVRNPISPTLTVYCLTRFV